MSNLNITIFGNKVFLEILNELSLFKKAKIKLVEDKDINASNESLGEGIIIFFLEEKNLNFMVPHFSSK